MPMAITSLNFCVQLYFVEHGQAGKRVAATIPMNRELKLSTLYKNKEENMSCSHNPNE